MTLRPTLLAGKVLWGFLIFTVEEWKSMEQAVW